MQPSQFDNAETTMQPATPNTTIPAKQTAQGYESLMTRAPEQRDAYGDRVIRTLVAQMPSDHLRRLPFQPGLLESVGLLFGKGALEVERSAKVAEAQDTSEEDDTGGLSAEGRYERENAAETDTDGPYGRGHSTEGQDTSTKSQKRRDREKAAKRKKKGGMQAAFALLTSNFSLLNRALMDETHFGGISTRGVREVLYDRLRSARKTMAELQQEMNDFERWMSFSLNADDTLELVGHFDTLGRFQTSWDEERARRDARAVEAEVGSGDH
jgi:hypothetical protein